MTNGMRACILYSERRLYIKLYNLAWSGCIEKYRPTGSVCAKKDLVKNVLDLIHRKTFKEPESLFMAATRND